MSCGYRCTNRVSIHIESQGIIKEIINDMGKYINYVLKVGEVMFIET